MNIGYARVSTDDQNLDLQRSALIQAGCEFVFEDQVSGMALRRPGLDQALARLGAGDSLVVWRLDRLGRSLPHLIDTIRLIGDRGTGFRSLTENIDTTTAGGRLYFHMMGALAEFERALIIERTRAGMKAAKARGVEVGRKRALSNAQISHAHLLVEGGESPSAVARSMKVGRSTALVHSVDGGRDDPSPGPLCDDPLATDGFRASCQQHPVQDGHADGSLGLLGSEAAGSQPWSNQRFVAAHCCFY